MRKIDVGLLVVQGWIYRALIVFAHVIYVWISEGEPRLLFSLTWGIINICLYYVFHYFFLRLFKMGKEGE